MYSNQYYDTLNPVSYTGARNIIRINKKNDPKKNKEERKRILTWLSQQDSYSLHKPVRRKFQRLYYAPNNIDDIWQIDLAVLINLEKYNDGYSYIMAVIDVLSKFVWVEILRDKKMTTIATAFEKILKRTNRRPQLLESDFGKEFIGKALQNVLKKYDIKFNTTRNNDTKCCVVERYFRTLKERMWRYFTHKQTYRYVDVIQNFVHSYNNTKHSTIKMLPSEVTLLNASQARDNMLSKFKNRKLEKKPKFTVGQFVRISKIKTVFQKGFEAGWSDEIFKVSKVLYRQGMFIYEITDLNNEIIDAIFYKEELNLVGKERLQENQQFLVDTVIKSRGVGKNKQLFVSWKGYPKTFNSWIKASDLKNI